MRGVNKGPVQARKGMIICLHYLVTQSGKAPYPKWGRGRQKLPGVTEQCHTRGWGPLSPPVLPLLFPTLLLLFAHTLLLAPSCDLG